MNQLQEVNTANLPKRDVNLSQFEDSAVLAGWQRSTIDIFLHPPRYLDYVKVGREMLRIRE